MSRSLLTLAACVLIAGVGAAQDKAVAITVGKVWVDGGEVLENATVVFKGGKIVGVGPGVSVPGGATRLEMKEATITAGMIDAAAQGLLSSEDTEDVSEVIPSYRVADVLDLYSRRMKTLAREGVTSVFATAAPKAVIGPQGAVVKTGADRGERVLVKDGDPKLTLSHAPSGGNRQARRRGEFTVFNRRPTSQMGVVYIARDAFTRAKEASEEEAAADPDLAVLRHVLAGRRRIRVFAEEQYEIATGLRIAKEFGLKVILENGIEAWRLPDEIAAADVAVVLGPIHAPPRPKLPRQFRRFLPPETRRRHTALTELLEKKITVCLTASAYAGDHGLREQATFALRHGADRGKVLDAVTRTPARMLGVSDRIGRVAAGFDADLVVWSGEPFDPSSRPLMVFVGGKRVEGQAF